MICLLPKTRGVWSKCSFSWRSIIKMNPDDNCCGSLPLCSVHCSVYCQSNSFGAVWPGLFIGTVPLGNVKYWTQGASDPTISERHFFIRCEVFTEVATNLGWLVCWLVDLLVGWLVGRSVDWLVCWLVVWFGLFVYLFVYWLVSWLVGCTFVSLTVVRL